MDINFSLRRKEIAELKCKGISAVEIARMYNISRQAVYQLLKKAERDGVTVTYKKNIKQPKTCQICNKSFYNSSKKVKTCSKECGINLRKQSAAKIEGKWSRYFILELTCDCCSKKFTRTKYLDSLARNAVKHKKHKNNYCSRECYHNRNYN